MTTDFWSGVPVISMYTPEQAIADGVLVDAHREPYEEVTAQHYGATPVRLTAALHGLIKRAVENKVHCNDFKGVWHDVLGVAFLFRRRLTRPGDRVHFRVIITGVGRHKYQDLAAVWDGEALTFMMRDED